MSHCFKKWEIVHEITKNMESNLQDFFILILTILTRL